MVKKGARVPDFILPTTHGEVRLTQLLTQGKVVLAFYTEDGTPD